MTIPSLHPFIGQNRFIDKAETKLKEDQLDLVYTLDTLSSETVTSMTQTRLMMNCQIIHSLLYFRDLSHFNTQ